MEHRNFFSQTDFQNDIALRVPYVCQRREEGSLRVGSAINRPSAKATPLLAVLLATMVLLACFSARPAFALAAPEDTATAENVLEVLQTYDADAYHIMKTQYDMGDDLTQWFDGGSIIAGIDTAVHEEAHIYSFVQAPFYAERIYTAEGRFFDVDYSVTRWDDFIKTEVPASLIPENLQTFRFDTYVEQGVNVSANTNGPFGLLNEYMAYYHGLEVMNSLVPYLIDSNASYSSWRTYATMVANGMNAYAEFTYWTLNYLLYVQSVNPSLYDAIMGNQAYRDAVTQISFLYRNEIQEGFSNVSRIGLSPSDIESMNHLIGDCNLLMEEMASRQAYVDLEIQLMGFPDVRDPSAWYYEKVYEARDLGLFSGYSSGDATGYFGPEDSLSRGMVVTLLYRAYTGMVGASTDNNVTTQFSDVASGQWYAAAGAWAAETGITTGYADGSGRFGPDDPVTREQLATFIARYAGYVINEDVDSLDGAGKAGDLSILSTRIDGSAVEPFARDAFAWCMANGIITGYDDGSNKLGPQDGATRAQMAKIIIVAVRDVLHQR